MLQIGDIYIVVEECRVEVYHGDCPPEDGGQGTGNGGDCYVKTYPDHDTAVFEAHELAWNFTLGYNDRERLLTELLGEPIGGY